MAFPAAAKAHLHPRITVPLEAHQVLRGFRSWACMRATFAAGIRVSLFPTSQRRPSYSPKGFLTTSCPSGATPGGRLPHRLHLRSSSFSHRATSDLADVPPHPCAPESVPRCSGHYYRECSFVTLQRPSTASLFPVFFTQRVSREAPSKERISCFSHRAERLPARISRFLFTSFN